MMRALTLSELITQLQAFAARGHSHQLVYFRSQPILNVTDNRQQQPTRIQLS